MTSHTTARASIVCIAALAFSFAGIAGAAARPGVTPPDRVGDRYVNETLATTSEWRVCNEYTAEANRLLAGGSPSNAASYVANVNLAKGCNIVFRAFVLAPA